MRLVQLEVSSILVGIIVWHGVWFLDYNLLAERFNEDNIAIVKFSSFGNYMERIVVVVKKPKTIHVFSAQTK